MIIGTFPHAVRRTAEAPLACIPQVYLWTISSTSFEALLIPAFGAFKGSTVYDSLDRTECQSDDPAKLLAEQEFLLLDVSGQTRTPSSPVFV